MTSTIVLCISIKNKTKTMVSLSYKSNVALITTCHLNIVNFFLKKLLYHIIEFENTKIFIIIDLYYLSIYLIIIGVY